MAGPRKKSADEMSIPELRQILIEKQRAQKYGKRRTRKGKENDRSEMGESILSAQNISPADDEMPEFIFRRKPKSTFLDKVLVAIEIIAVLGLIFLVFSLFGIIRNINEESRSALVLPTLTPTPLIQAVVLPSGHTPPNDPGGVRFNESEIPEHLRAHVLSMALLPVPTSSPEQAIRIQIPAISIDAPIVMGDGEEQLKQGVGQYIYSGNPGQPGNLVLSAHNDVYGEIFRYLDKLEAGDEIIIYTNQHSYTYIVNEWQIVNPLQVEVMAPTKDSRVTLISCYPYMVDTHRIVVSASLAAP